MEDGDNAYELLGLQEEASEADIKKAYRKLALQHHPDRQQTAENRQAAHAIFTKISHAYEILSDPQQRREYDQTLHSKNAPPQDDHQGPFHHHRHHHRPFRHPHSFHDPFEVFEQMFGSRRGPFGDPFGSMFDDDPFFQMGGGRSMFPPHGGFGPPGRHGHGMGGMMHPGMAFGGDPFESFFGGAGGGFPGGMGSSSVSTSTTTRIINGRRETVQEKVVHHPDGRVERTVQRNNDPPQRTTIESGGRASRSQPALPEGRSRNPKRLTESHSSRPSQSSQQRKQQPRQSQHQPQPQRQQEPVIDLTDDGVECVCCGSIPCLKKTLSSSASHRDKKRRQDIV
eukprot:Nitzschia sp. Nitz4//scaffold73_size107353//35386//36405//NITZ4_004312-RA/size107353-processed-gene-0.164-mRNA-1//1//CDS//3329557452//3564//frame0